jgi:Tol biopolymer transport system component
MRCAAFILAGLVFGMASCARLGFGPSDGRGSRDLDAGLSDALREDAAEADLDHDVSDFRLDAADLGDDAVPIDPLTPFGPAQVLTTVSSSAAEDDPSLTSDMTEIYYNRSDDIWRATRATASSPWSPPAPVAELNSSAAEGAPEVSRDGLVIYIASSRSHTAAKGDLDIYRSQRQNRSMPWSTPEHVAELSSASIDTDPVVATGELTLIMSSTRSGGTGSYDLYESSRASLTSTWTTPQPLTAINTTSSEFCPWLDPTRTVLYFASTRPGTGAMDLWMTQRSDPGSAFSPPQQLTTVNTTSNDLDPWLSPDQRTLYFVSDRGGNRDLYVAKR